MLRTVGIEIECGGIRDVPAGVIRNDSDVIANLTLVRITFERVKRTANGHVSRPGNTGIGAIRIK